MAWNIRSLAEGSARVRGAFRQYMPGTDSSLKNNFVTVAGKVIAAVAYEFELRMAWLAKQMFLSTATGPYLAMHCADVGIYRKPAAAAAGPISGTGTPNVTYPAGIRFTSGGNTYVTAASATAAANGVLSFTVQSTEFAAAANRDEGGLLALADRVLWPSLAIQWEVSAGGLGGGADVEDDESLRDRGLQRKRFPPGGGTLNDYERIARSVPGVTKAWAFRDTLSPGFIVVFFLFRGRDDFIPEASDVAAVQAAIEAERLIRVDDNVAQAPIAQNINVVINDLQADTDEIRAAIEANIRAILFQRCRPGIPADPFVLPRSWISEAISQTVGEDRHTLVTPVSDTVLTNGRFPVLGAIDYGS